MVFMQSAEPLSLYCADESDGEALRACEQIMESLYAYEIAGTAPIPRSRPNACRTTDLDDVDLHAARGRDVPRRGRRSTPTTSC